MATPDDMKARMLATFAPKMEFTRPIKPVGLPSGKSSSLAGTQTIDTTWTSLDSAIPKTLHTKANHQQNPLIEKYTFVWLYRINHKNCDGFTTLGAEFRD